jgi:hypothetical protein
MYLVFNFNIISLEVDEDTEPLDWLVDVPPL